MSHQNCFLKRLFFYPLNCLSISVKYQLIISVRFNFSTLHVPPLIYLPHSSTILPYYCSFVVNLEISKFKSSPFYSSFRNCFTTPVNFHINFKISSSISTKKLPPTGEFLELGKNANLTLNLPIEWLSICFIIFSI